MRIIAEKTVKDWATGHPEAAASLLGWLQTARTMAWRSILDVRRQYGHADAVIVASGHVVTVFNIAGNKYRLLTAIHYDAGVVYTLMFLSHREYDAEKWKKQL